MTTTLVEYFQYAFHITGLSWPENDVISRPALSEKDAWKQVWGDLTDPQRDCVSDHECVDVRKVCDSEGHSQGVFRAVGVPAVVITNDRMEGDFGSDEPTWLSEFHGIKAEANAQFAAKAMNLHAEMRQLLGEILEERSPGQPAIDRMNRFAHQTGRSFPPLDASKEDRDALLVALGKWSAEQSATLTRRIEAMIAKSAP